MSTESDFMRGGRPSPPPPLHPVDTHSIPGIERMVESAKLAERERLDAVAAQAAELRAREQAARDATGEMLDGLAGMLRVPASHVAAVIELRLPTLDQVNRPIAGVVLRFVRGEVGQLACAEAVHALAGSVLPTLAKGDQIFAPLAKALREIPPFKALQYTRIPPDWFPDWCKSVGIAVPSDPIVDCEPESVYVRRIEGERASGYFGTGSESYEIARRAVAMMNERFTKAVDSADRAHFKALEDLRARVVAIVDPVVAGLQIGPAWWWARDFRRTLTREPSRIPAPLCYGHQLTAWHMSQLLGVHFPFSNLKG